MKTPRGVVTTSSGRTDAFPNGYAPVIGDTWWVASTWRKIFPRRPFLGIRYDGTDVWVLFDRGTANELVGAVTLERIRTVFDAPGDAWTDDNVFLRRAPTLRAGHALARRVVRILESERGGSTPGGDDSSGHGARGRAN